VHVVQISLPKQMTYKGIGRRREEGGSWSSPAERGWPDCPVEELECQVRCLTMRLGSGARSPSD